MSKSDQIYAIWLNSRAVAFEVLKDEVLKVLPKGWTLHLMVGWGVNITKPDGNTVESGDVLPKGVRRIGRLAVYFCKLYEYGNEKIEGIV